MWIVTDSRPCTVDTMMLERDAHPRGCRKLGGLARSGDWDRFRTVCVHRAFLAISLSNARNWAIVLRQPIYESRPIRSIRRRCEARHRAAEPISRGPSSPRLCANADWITVKRDMP